MASSKQIDYGLQDLVCPMLTASPDVVSLSGTTARSNALSTHRMYRIISTADCYVKQGGSTVVAHSSNSHYLPANQPVDVWVTSTSDQYIAGITVSAGSASLYVSSLR